MEGGCGREQWFGDVHFRCEAYVGRKSEWATWTPPREMIKRQPEAAKWARVLRPTGGAHVIVMIDRQAPPAWAAFLRSAWWVSSVPN